MYKKFTDVILTPSCFYKDMGVNHQKFDSYMELCYLHPNYFTPDFSVLEKYGFNKSERYVVLRFVSWSASHDVGHSGIDLDTKIELVDKLSKYAKVYISSEAGLPGKLQKYQLRIPPHEVHHLLAHAQLFVGEGGTMAAECAMLGTPAIYINSIPLMGYLKDEVNAGLIFHFSSSSGVTDKAIEFISDLKLKEKLKKRSNTLISNKIDPTSFMIWLVENYPNSIDIIKSDPTYQSNFK